MSKRSPTKREMEITKHYMTLEIQKLKAENRDLRARLAGRGWLIRVLRRLIGRAGAC